MNSKTILVADDSNLVRKIVTDKLKKTGYTVLESTNGTEALCLLDGRDIHLLITDLNMPLMDGLNLITALRSNNYYQYIPIILFISDEIVDKTKFIKNSGATVGFDKKNIHEKLVGVVKKLIR